MSKECEYCPMLRHCINGGFCIKLNKYIEYDRKKGCDESEDDYRGV